jgi:hypothetical protein
LAKVPSKVLNAVRVVRRRAKKRKSTRRGFQTRAYRRHSPSRHHVV